MPFIWVRTNAVYRRTEDTDNGSNISLTSLIPPASRLNVFPNARFHDYFPSSASACPCIRWVLERGIPTILPKSWFSGHTRPLCVLAARLVLGKENLVLTFFAPPHQLEQVREDILNQYLESLISSDMKEKVLKRVRLVVRIPLAHYCLLFFNAIRIVTTFKSTDNNILNLSTLSFQSYPAAYETLYHSRPFTCATTGKVFDALPPPVAVILDVRNHALQADQDFSLLMF